MAHIITQVCCNDGACVDVCPVQCIRPRPGDPQYSTAEQLYIDPKACIDCGVCQEACPVGAIYADYDLPAEFDEYREINAAHFAADPILDWSLRPLPDDARSVDEGRLRVAIVGSGPSACYAAAELIGIAGVEVSIFERLPTPFGLVRSGVAPDHQQTKRVADQFGEVLSHPSVRCYFNVEVGRDVSLAEILEHHHAVIYAGGAKSDRQLGIPGEHLPGSHSAREFVAWYNGHPDQAGRTYDLSSRRAVIIGNGNVALDVARVLARPAGRYATTDLADHALDALDRSMIRDVVVAARRGAHEAAYTTSELLALRQLEDVTVVSRADEVRIDDQRLSAACDAAIGPIARRKRDLVAAMADAPVASDGRSISLRYMLSPLEIHGSERVEAVSFARSRLMLKNGALALEPTNAVETIETRLVIRAAGYRGQPVPGFPFDQARGVIPNRAGRVWDRDADAPFAGLYCAGWIKRGPSGLIGTNRVCSRETVAALLEDFATERLARAIRPAADFDALMGGRCASVDAQAWRRIDGAERAAGARRNRPRTKFVRVEDMLASASGDAG
ncbi:4Fe-4S binding protein [Sphingomonas sp. YL-JM2C]